MLIGLDHVLSYGIVFLALAFFLRPMLYRIIGRKSSSAMACHSNSDTGCQGGCSACPLTHKQAQG